MTTLHVDIYYFNDMLKMVEHIDNKILFKVAIKSDAFIQHIEDVSCVLTFPLAGGQLDEEAGGVQAALDRGAHVCG